MLRKIILAIIISFCFYNTACGYWEPSENIYKETETEIIEVLKGAVEDTKWMKASSRPEMESILGNYYTGPLLSQLSEAAWSFINVPTDWEYINQVKDCKVTMVSGSKASACVDIIESDAATGVSFLTKFEYTLIITVNGWRIADSKILPE